MRHDRLYKQCKKDECKCKEDQMDKVIGLVTFGLGLACILLLLCFVFAGY